MVEFTWSTRVDIISQTHSRSVLYIQSWIISNNNGQLQLNELYQAFTHCMNCTRMNYMEFVVMRWIYFLGSEVKVRLKAKPDSLRTHFKETLTREGETSIHMPAVLQWDKFSMVIMAISGAICRWSNHHHAKVNGKFHSNKYVIYMWKIRLKLMEKVAISSKIHVNKEIHMDKPWFLMSRSNLNEAYNCLET